MAKSVCVCGGGGGSNKFSHIDESNITVFLLIGVFVLRNYYEKHCRLRNIGVLSIDPGKNGSGSIFITGEPIFDDNFNSHDGRLTIHVSSKHLTQMAGKLQTLYENSDASVKNFAPFFLFLFISKPNEGHVRFSWKLY